MSDVQSAAPAAEVTVPLDSPATANGGLGSQIPETHKPDAPRQEVPSSEDAPKKPEDVKASRREAIEKAVRDGQDKAKALKEEAAKDAAKPEAGKQAAEAKPQQQRDRTEQGKFAAKAAQPQPDGSQPAARKYEPPARFNEHSKAEWDSIPEATQSEIVRATENIERGYEKYRSHAERYEAFRELDELARNNGGDLRRGLDEYIRVENLLRSDPVAAIVGLSKTFGFDLIQVASRITGSPVSQQHQHTQQLLAAKDREIAELRGHIQSQRDAEETQRVVDEARSKFPDFEAVAPQVVEILQTLQVSGQNNAERLENAYRLAKRFGLGQSSPATASPAEQPASSASPNPAGQKSVSGAPPLNLKVKPKGKDGTISRRDAISNALARSGAI